MKKNFSEILNSLDANELGPLLDGTHPDPLDHSTVERIQAEVLSKTSTHRKKIAANKPWRAIAAFAACFILLISIGFGTYVYAAEVKEYNDAVRFFHDYDLSTEGLTRGEIKAVYRDITTESFTYSKTAEVIRKSLSTDQVDGYEILQDAPTPEDIENLWNDRNAKGIHYEFRNEYERDDQLGFDVLAGSYLEKYNGETLLWSVCLTEFGINGYSIVSDGVIAHGFTPRRTMSVSEPNNAWIAKINDGGSILWTHRMDHGFDYEFIINISENDDGGYEVASRGDRYFCLSQYTADGSVTHFQKTDMGNDGILNAARFADGYIVQLGNDLTNEHAKIVKLDRFGHITGSFSYDSEDTYYYITDMIEYDDNIYLSAYAVPKLADEDPSAGSRYEIASVLNYLHDNDIWDISNEELTPMVRDNYTAMLLVCDPSVGTPQEFYSVKGSLGGDLTLSDSGTLLWDVERITTAFLSLETSSFTIGGTCHVFRYTFDDNGALISQEKTGEITNYTR